jgi:CRISPR-associated endonuclease/helicase Cas3
VDYRDIFKQATGREPYPYQHALATADALPDALVAPTGAGKTAAVALAWLYRRRYAGDAVRRETARRLVLCLPMRVLVEQTADAVRGWLRALDLLAETTDQLQPTDKIAVHVLMGGAVPAEWHLQPEQDAVLVGTQDMLLSRALNRGYGSSRFQWPWHFGLLTNDCCWVLDEVQLMGVGLATALQLAAFRRALGTYGPAHTLFMSATLERSWLATVDHPAPDPTRILGLSVEDRGHLDLARRHSAPKRLSRALSVIRKGFEKDLAAEVIARHVPDTRTIVVMNTVGRAVALWNALDRSRKKGKGHVELLHSRFRPRERAGALGRVLAPGFDGIVVSTQVIEAGVDVSARTLFTELSPWASLVQRAGRCNRDGKLTEADVVWIDHDDDTKTALPYERDELRHARGQVQNMTCFNPEAIEAAGVELPAPEPTHVLRRRDLFDLFDTTPDLAGADLDVSRFIRDGGERDVQVFWRHVGGKPADDERRPARDELCSVPVGELRPDERAVWRWDHVVGAWERVSGALSRRIVPGGVYLLDAAQGGYTEEQGWDPTSREPVVPVERKPNVSADPEDSLPGDRDSFLALRGPQAWVPLTTHALDTRDAAREILRELGLGDLPADTLLRAAQAHDLGKAHPEFQATMKRDIPPECAADTLWAKSGNRSKHQRRGLRHELASALAWLEHGDVTDRDLVAYLLAAHHGKVRLSIRALPDDAPPDNRAKLHARGIWEGDELPGVDLGDGLALPGGKLDLAPMQLGRQNGKASWAERMLVLRDSPTLGPFRLAFLEALVRAADVRATRLEEQRGNAAPPSPSSKESAR